MADSLPFLDRFQKRLASRQSQQLILRTAGAVSAHSQPSKAEQPVLLFNASTRIQGLSLNAAFQMLTGWSLRLSGVPVHHFLCESGLQPCVLGTNREDHTKSPPCKACLAQSARIYTGASTRPFQFQANQELSLAVDSLSVAELSQLQIPARQAGLSLDQEIPLGSLVLPSVRWALRMHHLENSQSNRYLLRQYILSAYRVLGEFASALQSVQPAAVLVFNGIMYPEAAARWVSKALGFPTYAHEVGFQRNSAFFTEGQPTAYPMDIPEDFELTEAENQRLDEYLAKRFQGQFSMAGIQFWPEMRRLDEEFLAKAAEFKQIVPVFTNVVYDTSQVHANVVFPHMFAWLDHVLEIIHRHPETLFVIRAHPDEMRPNSKKLSRESVREWVKHNRLDQLDNVVFIDSQEYLSSYELIQRSKFVIVYNSSIGLEATLLGVCVLCGGKARYTQVPMVYFPDTPEAFDDQAEKFLSQGLNSHSVDSIPAPDEYVRNARRFLYYQLYRTSLPFGDFIEASPRQGFVQLRRFNWEALLPENSPTMQIIHDGLFNHQPFILPRKSS
ncbi:MAG TPA: hypothetical protein VN363_00580 [Anaerolineales bacterium]|nr:hypothetical protein [Anaerolineales bacterium]